MVLFQCPRCGYKFERKANYIDHINKKNICDYILNDIEPTSSNFIKLNYRFTCDKCNKTYANKGSLKEHACKPINITYTTNNNITSNGDHNTINNINNNVSVHIENLTINDYKNTNDSYLTEEQIYNCIKKNMNAIPTVLEALHYNIDHPENHNIYISNFKNKTVRFKEGNRWILKKYKDVAEDIIIGYHNRYFNPFYENDEAMSKYNNSVKTYNQYLTITEGKEAYEKISDNIFDIMYNKRNIVQKTNNLPIK